MTSTRHSALCVLLTVCLALGVLATAVACAADKPIKPAAAAKETQAQRDARMKWWRDAKFGMFIHWGLYAVPAGEWKGKKIPGIGEWIMHRAKIPAKEYEQLAKQFNPVKFDADAWAQLAQDAGQKYMVITSKHHDGFAMYHSKASKYNIVDATPFDRDPLKELAAACRKRGIKFGFYYSQAQDWHHPGGAGNFWDKSLKRVPMEQYLKTKALPQVRELLTHYGKIDIFWWDTPKNMTRKRAEMLRPPLRLQPHIIRNNRLGGGFAGDFGTPEQHIPGKRPAGDWETCMTMNGTWGYKHYDNKWKSTKDLVRKLIDITSKGGNFLLNVGPKADGTIPEPSIERLREMGKWLKVNGQAVYGTTASPWGQPAWGRYTAKGKKLYAHIFDWPKDGILRVGPGSPEAAWLLNRPRDKLKVTAHSAGAHVRLPKRTSADDSIATVVVLQLNVVPQGLTTGEDR